ISLQTCDKCNIFLFSDEQGLFIGFLNSFVHVIMYSYYLIAALGPQYQKYLWWKKYMTWIQLTQFCIMLVYLFSIPMMGCKLSKSVTFFFAGNVAIFLYLFADFYRKAYTKKSKNASSIPNGCVKASKLE
ncbi:elongation of very long chain fatty acids protein AAEL008004-like, partial [Anoplophora glabripennis]|uniref:elongation of very long chain fatty acids protein AAEL008004-like n=1 Tax=Anoplophora glabripennis TaxID=217634 RepID=UPI000C7830BF